MTHRGRVAESLEGRGAAPDAATGGAATTAHLHAVSMKQLKKHRDWWRVHVLESSKMILCTWFQ